MSEWKVQAPFTSDQCLTLNRYQFSGVTHPFTHGAVVPTFWGEREHRCLLVAIEDGWRCPDEACDYTQDWAWAWMAEPGSWLAVGESR